MIKYTFKEHRIQLVTQGLGIFRQTTNVPSKVQLFTYFLSSECSSLLLHRKSLITSGLERKDELHSSSFWKPKVNERLVNLSGSFSYCYPKGDFIVEIMKGFCHC